jgi:hypothetical protein
MIDAHKNAKHIYVLMGIAIAFMFTIGAFFEEGVAFFDPVYTTIMSDLEYYLSLIAVLLSVGIFLFLAHRYYIIKINWAFFSIAVVLVVCNTIAVLAFPSLYSTMGMNQTTGDIFPVVYFLTGSERLRFIITFAVTCLYLYLVFAVIPKVLRNSKQLTIYFYGGIVVVFVSIVWSLIYEFNVYRAYFDPSMTPTLQTIAESFYNNRNTFGTMIVIGICACGYLQCQSHHWWYYLIMGVFSAELFFVLSKTSMLLVSIFWVAFLIYRYVITLKAHPVKNNVILGVLLAIVGFLAWFIVSGTIQKTPSINKIFKNFVDAIADTSEDTMASRANIWKLCIQELNNPLRIIFGMGDGNFMCLLGPMMNNGIVRLGYTHNGILAMLDYGGIVRLGIYAAMLIYFLLLVIQNFRHKRPNTFVCLLAFILMFIQSFVETTSFMGADSKSLSLLIMIYLPVLTDNFQDKHKEILVDQSAAFAAYPPTKPAFVLNEIQTAKIFLTFGTPVLLLVIVLYPSVPVLHNGWFLVNAIALYLLCPLIGGCLHGFSQVKTKGTVIGVRLVSCMVMGACFFLPLLMDNAIGFFAGLLSTVSLLIILFLLSQHGREKSFLDYLHDVYLPYAAVVLGLVTFGFGLQLLGNLVTRYVVICLAAILLAGFFLIAFASPLSSFFLYPFNEKWLWREEMFLHANTNWEMALAQRNDTYGIRHQRKLKPEK